MRGVIIFMKKYIGAGLIALGLIVSVHITPAQAVSEAGYPSGLTPAQILAVTNLLASFGADAATIKNVDAALRGNGTPVSSSGNAACLTLYGDLYIGRTDAQTNGEVSKLQQFLGISPTGYYGNLTAQAVMNWQKAHGMDYVTLKSGVGPTTRGKLKEGCQSATPAPVINSITPASVRVGGTLTLSGSNFLGFEGDKYLWVKNSTGVKGVLYGEHDGSNSSVRAVLPAKLCQIDVSYSGKDCPAYLDLIPGTYTLEAVGWGGTSNSVSFMIANQ
jgi:peptidoglycan hydrolase-like protein with peptidoglycan-binding domain